MIIRNKYLHIETYGSKNNPAILYLHGGPGESCYAFTYHQAKNLQKDFYLIALDQRGVCRSKGIAGNEEFVLMDLIEDCEALRKELHIDKWSLIGHSFGGYLALLYVTQYPSSIEKVIYECPTFDFELTARSNLRKTAQLLKKYGNDVKSDECLKWAESDSTTQKLTEIYGTLSDELGEHRMEIYRYNESHPTDYSQYTDEEWDEFYDRSAIHYERLKEEGEIFTSLLPKLKEVSHPMLLIVGKHDPVTCKFHIESFAKDVKNGTILLFDESGHTPHYEEPDKFKEVVCEFLSKTKQRSTNE